MAYKKKSKSRKHFGRKEYNETKQGRVQIKNKSCNKRQTTWRREKKETKSRKQREEIKVAEEKKEKKTGILTLMSIM